MISSNPAIRHAKNASPPTYASIVIDSLQLLRVDHGDC